MDGPEWNITGAVAGEARARRSAAAPAQGALRARRPAALRTGQVVSGRAAAALGARRLLARRRRAAVARRGAAGRPAHAGSRDDRHRAPVHRRAGGCRCGVPADASLLARCTSTPRSHRTATRAHCRRRRTSRDSCCRSRRSDETEGAGSSPGRCAETAVAWPAIRRSACACRCARRQFCRSDVRVAAGSVRCPTTLRRAATALTVEGARRPRVRRQDALPVRCATARRSSAAVRSARSS